ncbi:glycine cleavage system protein H [Limosilactobacillus fastidiosus]|uniref:Glycine cleavage system protein H n=1 Tax=Limosilactobacillus fastidiosus TaxID=2759855 RepID=A0A7W3YBW8_9LACO|nr:glycine cleavage system protein H [Limosilactobacillus fastidiosus]MBB1063034.1 glycine cleavage system protein H [Limosilactobacillus fastidiosus]MBB1085713.1 glycine cleavage system protein H [Limosilactobacillus fastidiosus]MCD7083885.1 glycine cleavage system protein H [Limosilactobacillus fastidiosus]MCD7086192.1 glycine cleavage system protein H [Limosilactobacillus fastidiosus]MCD7114053.1 glycine cleavage system protein H [Limosilactobacillus fastidiosus]
MVAESYFWVKKQDNGNVRIGLNDSGRDDLGQIGFIDVPATGTKLINGGKFIAVEAEKAVTDLDSPVDGEIVTVNQKAIDQPELLDSSDERDNWIVEVKA